MLPLRKYGAWDWCLLACEYLCVCVSICLQACMSVWPYVWLRVYVYQQLLHVCDNGWVFSKYDQRILTGIIDIGGTYWHNWHNENKCWSIRSTNSRGQALFVRVEWFQLLLISHNLWTWDGFWELINESGLVRAGVSRGSGFQSGSGIHMIYRWVIYL